MYQQHTSTFGRPRHLLDLHGATVWSLAATGSAFLRLAHTLDRASAARSAAQERPARLPRSRVGPSQDLHARHLIPETWRIR